MSSLDPISIRTNDQVTTDWASIPMLKAFAYVDGWGDPPFLANRITKKDMLAEPGVVFLVEDNSDLVVGVFLNPKTDAMYLGKLSVDPLRQGEGIGRRSCEASVEVAKAQGYAEIELQARIEVVENHATFTAMEFCEAGRTANDGSDWPTSVTMKCRL